MSARDVLFGEDHAGCEWGRFLGGAVALNQYRQAPSSKVSVRMHRILTSSNTEH